MARNSKIYWTKAQDAVIRRGRAKGLSWEAIGAAMGLSRNAVIERGRRLRVDGGLPTAQPASKPKSHREQLGHGPLPPMHPDAWSIIAGLSAGAPL